MVREERGIRRMGYKTKTVSLCVGLGIGLALYHHFTHQDQVEEVPQVGSSVLVKRAEVVDSHTVITAMHNLSQIVGMEGQVHRSYAYKDSMFESDIGILNWLGERGYTMDVQATFKMGINLNDISEKDIVVSNGNVLIFLPKPIVISFEMPYDNIGVGNKTGVLRSHISEQSKQKMYGIVRKSILDDIRSDNKVLSQATKGSQQALRDLLGRIVGTNNIVFVNL